MPDKQKLDSKAKDLYRDGEEDETLRKALNLGVKYFDLRKTEIADDTLSLFSKEEAEKCQAFPVYDKNKHLIIGSTDPQSKELSTVTDSLKKYFKLIELALISKPSFDSVISRYGGIKKAELGKRDDTIKVDVTITSFEELNRRLSNAPIQDLLKLILSSAMEADSSDIHVEPNKEDVFVRFRIDGALHAITHLTQEKYKYLLSQIELQAKIKLGVNYAQQGRFDIKHDDLHISVRVETIPTLYGDDVAIRIFNTQTEFLKMSDLGILDEEFNVIKEAISKPHGMILISGPTGSGKTSTIYAILNELNKPDVKIITLEDPIEYALTGLTQSQINEGESFADRLKATLREDPDIIMVGEIRDEGTAKTALQAALTGHLMISTVHANNAVTSIIRMVDLTKDAPTFTASISLLIAQRLVRKICEHCKEEYEPTELERKEAKRILGTFKPVDQNNIKLKFFKGKGCDKCNNIGYKGRIGIFEFLQPKEELQRLISANANIFDLQKAAIENGMVTMEQDGLIKVSRGITTISDLIKAVKE
ncbi:hypothetical protein COY62_02810 [bacterium (Candidatus Howlettbacteria) CG_4_10_14_0_8_um_filter_40_9]|nr:MAG: hypothetical protein COY62_02810 [bacterium (Candidatus Howlettbacteria) CG_4_10_14_0_8_um_filter_40_9]